MLRNGTSDTDRHGCCMGDDAHTVAGLLLWPARLPPTSAPRPAPPLLRWPGPACFPPAPWPWRWRWRQRYATQQQEPLAREGRTDRRPSTVCQTLLPDRSPRACLDTAAGCFLMLVACRHTRKHNYLLLCNHVIIQRFTPARPCETHPKSENNTFLI